MFNALKAVKPFCLNAPIKPDEENYTKAYANKGEKNILATQVLLYSRVIQKNDTIIEEQAKLSTRISWLLGIIVVLILVIILS